MKDTRLYIADKLVDLDGESIITMNYTLEDTNNPTIVKNSFSKSISLPATENNNALFGHIYNLTRETIIDDTKMAGAYFNTLKRTPFKLFIEGELVESGYVQLTNISNINGVPRYTIQAYGGLGDFLYNLMYDEAGDRRNLASLNFGFDGYSGEAKDEMNFRVSRNIISEAWSNLPRSERNTFSEAITFVPAYNGVSKDFDSQHALFNYEGVAAMNIPRTLSNGDTTYSSLNGYGCLEFKRSLDEAETKDLRSYLQRPAISVKALFDACANPDNNGGYKVTLDKSFFKEENTLYWDAYVTLPMMSTEIEKTESTTAIRNGAGYVGGTANAFVRDVELGNINVSAAPINATIKLNVPMSVFIERDAGGEYYLGADVYEWVERESFDGITLGGLEYVRTYHSALVAQLVVYGNDGSIISASNEVALSSFGNFARTWGAYQKLDNIDRGVANVKGYFKTDGDRVVFISEENNNTFTLSASLIKGSHKTITIGLRLQRAYKEAYDTISTDASVLFTNGRITIGDPLINSTLEDWIVRDNVIGAQTINAESVVSATNLPSISSNSLVTKEILLGNTESPADYLLSYIKLFNLRIIKDVTEKTVTITPHYFNGEIVDIDDRIDRGQDVAITPNLVTKKFMRMGLNQPDTYFSQKYHNMHKVSYGQKRIDTGFAFNNDTEELYQGNIYTSAIPCLATSRFFNTFYNKSGNEVYAPLADNPKLILANGLSEVTGFATYGEEMVSATFVDPAKTMPFNINRGYDLMPRMCYFDESEEVREAVDISNNLVVFCGKRTLTNSNGEAVSYWLTDDVPEMIHLAGKNCYLLTNSIYPEGVECKSLPLFLSMRLSSRDIVLDSFDFAKGKEHYIPGIVYPDGVTLYDKYWASLYADRLHVDSCKVTCFVDLAGLTINGEALRKFYYFDNNHWLLNKVVDYDPTTERLTKCEFIKVRDIGAYYTPGESAEATTIEDNEE